MRPRFQADADFNQKIVLGLRRRERAVDFEDAHAAGVSSIAARVQGWIIVPQDLDIGLAIEDLLLIWAATDAEEWTDKVGFLPL